MSSPVAPQAIPHTHESARELIAAVRPAFELIEDRAADYSDLDANTIIADNAWCGGVVLGDPVDNWHTAELGLFPNASQNE